MNFDDYVDACNDPRQPMGLFGPIGRPAVYLITADRTGPAQRGRQRPSEDDARLRERFAQHQKAAEHDRIVRRLRSLR